jgi:hypothetical protein
VGVNSQKHFLSQLLCNFLNQIRLSTMSLHRSACAPKPIPLRKNEAPIALPHGMRSAGNPVPAPCTAKLDIDEAILCKLSRAVRTLFVRSTDDEYQGAYIHLKRRQAQQQQETYERGNEAAGPPVDVDQPCERANRLLSSQSATNRGAAKPKLHLSATSSLSYYVRCSA